MNLAALPLHPGRVTSAVRAEWAAMSTPFRIWLGVLAVGLAIGGVAALILLPPGWEVTGTTPTVEWGLLIAGYAAFAIATSGLCLTSSLGTVFGVDRFRPLERRHAILAILCLCTAFGIIALDLHWPIRMVFGVVLSPAPSSPMWWMGVAYGGYLVILLVEVWSMFVHRPRLHQAVCTMAAGMAIVAPSTLGAVFGSLVNRPLWHGPISSLYMLATAVLGGCGVLVVVFTLVERLDLRGAERATPRVIPGLRMILPVALVVSAAFVAREIVSGFTSTEPGMRQAVDALVAGPLAASFWIGRVGLGLVAPMLLLASRRNGAFLAAGILTLLGVVVDRTLFVIGGLIAPTSSSVGGVVSEPYARYIPSPVEVGVIVGAVALVAFVYTFIERYVDLGFYDPHVGLSLAPIRRWRASRVARAAQAAAAAEDSCAAPADASATSDAELS